MLLTPVDAMHASRFFSALSAMHILAAWDFVELEH
jgi:hypothetical protein